MKWRQDATKFFLKNGEVRSLKRHAEEDYSEGEGLRRSGSERIRDRQNRDYIWDMLTIESMRTRMIAVLWWKRKFFWSNEKEKISRKEWFVVRSESQNILKTTQIKQREVVTINSSTYHIWNKIVRFETESRRNLELELTQKRRKSWKKRSSPERMYTYK